MTMTALNLRVDKKRVETAKKIAHQCGSSLSFLVDGFFFALDEMNRPVSVESLHPVLRDLAGSIASDEDYREAVEGEIERKHAS